MISKKDFTDWKSHPVTKEVFGILRERIEGLQQELGLSAGKDSYLDALKVGAIQAHRDILEIEIEGDFND